MGRGNASLPAHNGSLRADNVVEVFKKTFTDANGLMEQLFIWPGVCRVYYITTDIMSRTSVVSHSESVVYITVLMLQRDSKRTFIGRTWILWYCIKSQLIMRCSKLFHYFTSNVIKDSYNPYKHSNSGPPERLRRPAILWRQTRFILELCSNKNHKSHKSKIMLTWVRKMKSQSSRSRWHAFRHHFQQVT